MAYAFTRYRVTIAYTRYKIAVFSRSFVDLPGKQFKFKTDTVLFGYSVIAAVAVDIIYG